jgi:hypothetical protein
MLTKFDELTCHQAVQTFDAPASTDRAWTEKLWCNVHDKTGGLVLAAGFGVYPNRNVMDAFGCVNVRNAKQTNLRASRELRPRLDELRVGPLSWEVLEPFRRIGLRCGENPQGLRFELEFVGRYQPAEEAPQFGRSRGRVYVHTCRWAQLGRARGWVEVEGRRHEVDEETYCAQRDHSWGIRMGVGAPEQGVQESDIASFAGLMINWLTVQVGGRAIECYLIEHADGTVRSLTGHVCPALDDPAPPVPIVRVEHAWEYHPRSARMRGGRVVFHTADGGKLELAMRELTTMYLRGGGYAGVKGFTHGLWKGPQWQDGEVWNVEDPVVANEVHGLDDTVVEVECDGQRGWGIVENMIMPPFPRYGFHVPPRG